MIFQPRGMDWSNHVTYLLSIFYGVDNIVGMGYKILNKIELWKFNYNERWMTVGQSHKLNSEEHIDVKVWLRTSIQDRTLKGIGQWIIKNPRVFQKRRPLRRELWTALSFADSQVVSIQERVHSLSIWS